MSEEKLPKLSEGSKWSNIGMVITNAGESSIGVDMIARDGTMFAYGPDCDVDPTFDSGDVLALIDRANMDPVRIAARKLIRKLDDESYRDNRGFRIIEWHDIEDEFKELEALL